ncbi:MAG TPA: hypothetical protein ENH87_02100 [Pricia antarctica]|uniref:SEC-C motif-containing protein n=1 Tax=Pricia antarctica TaxID=641691 RepID=A0A831QN12_9FLAO|nr:hypothetical protein [Pricia antarctica]
MTEPLEKTDPEFALRVKNYVNFDPNLHFRPKLKTKREYLKNKIGRNDPCICGSGKKYKRCCL